MYRLVHSQRHPIECTDDGTVTAAVGTVRPLVRDTADRSGVVLSISADECYGFTATLRWSDRSPRSATRGLQKNAGARCLAIRIRLGQCGIGIPLDVTEWRRPVRQGPLTLPTAEDLNGTVPSRTRRSSRSWCVWCPTGRPVAILHTGRGHIRRPSRPRRGAGVRASRREPRR